MDIPIVEATRENISEYGTYIDEGTPINQGSMTIPFYQGEVEEGKNLDVHCNSFPKLRTARLKSTRTNIYWLERHMNLTQLFVGIGKNDFVVVLGKPTHPSMLPDISSVKAFRIPAGYGILLHLGTWHDFPFAYNEPVTVLTLNSDEVINALGSLETAREMNEGDVFKIDLQKNFKSPLHINCK